MLEQIDHDDVRVVADPDPTSSVRSPWRTYRACLDTISPDASHLLVVQDDATFCLDFAETVLRIIAARPDDAIALFTPNVGLHGRAIMQACAADERYAVLPAREWTPVVATLYPRVIVDELCAYAAAKNLSPVMRCDDANIGSFIRETGRRVLATVPSLVDHADDVPSLVGNPAFSGANPQRTAACWMGEELSPLTLQWD